MTDNNVTVRTAVDLDKMASRMETPSDVAVSLERKTAVEMELLVTSLQQRAQERLTHVRDSHDHLMKTLAQVGDNLRFQIEEFANLVDQTLNLVEAEDNLVSEIQEKTSAIVGAQVARTISGKRNGPRP